MSARGYDGNIRVLEDLPSPRKATLAGIILLDVALVLATVLMITFGV